MSPAARHDRLTPGHGAWSAKVRTLARWRVDVRDPALSMEDVRWLWRCVRGACLRLLLRWARH